MSEAGAEMTVPAASHPDDDPRGALARPGRRPVGRAPVRERLRRVARHRVTGREALRALAAGLAVLVPSLLFGVATASAEASLGPHRASYEVTLDHRVTVDLGPLGTLVIDSPVPVLGVRVTVGEIPREITELGNATTLEALSDDLERYVQFFSAPRATLAVVVRALVADAARGTVGAAVVLTVVVVALRSALGARRRGELAAALRPVRGRIAAGTALAVVLGATMAAAGTRVEHGHGLGPPSPVFEGTALEGAVVTGRLAGILDTYGAQALAAYRQTEEFYARAAADLRTQWADQTRAQARVDEVRRSSGLALPRRDAPEPVRLLLVSDLHCNVGMAPVIRAALEESGAQVLLNAGDTTMNGTTVENYCVTAFAQAAGDVPVVVSDGNHDSPAIAEQERGQGWTVLDGQVVEVAGVRILGAGDPRATRVGVGTVLEGEETLEDRAAHLHDVACGDAEGVDLLLTHDERMGEAIVRDGCAPAQVSGHYHRRIGPVRTGAGVQYVSASTAGALLGRPTIGPLSGVAEMTVLSFDPLTRAITDYQLVFVHPDASVRVSHPISWPALTPGPLAPPPEPDEPR